VFFFFLPRDGPQIAILLCMPAASVLLCPVCWFRWGIANFFLPRLALYHDPVNLHFPRSWDYRHGSLCSALNALSLSFFKVFNQTFNGKIIK
jgi:hypothetical protein